VLKPFCCRFRRPATGVTVLVYVRVAGMRVVARYDWQSGSPLPELDARRSAVGPGVRNAVVWPRISRDAPTHHGGNYCCYRPSRYSQGPKARPQMPTFWGATSYEPCGWSFLPLLTDSSKFGLCAGRQDAFCRIPYVRRRGSMGASKMSCLFPARTYRPSTLQCTP